MPTQKTVSNTLRVCNKPKIDSTVYNKWPAINEGLITNDGNYVCYTIENHPIGFNTAVIKSWNNKKKLVIPHTSSPIVFSPDSKFAFWINDNDSLGIASLKYFTVSYVRNIRSFELKKNFLIYQSKGPNNDLTIKNLKSNKIYSYYSVSFHQTSGNNEYLTIVQTERKNGLSVQELNYARIGNAKLTKIWRGSQIKNITIDKNGKQIAFMGTDDFNRNGIWYYKTSVEKPPICLLNDESSEIKEGLKLEKLKKFSHLGDKIVITLMEKEKLSYKYQKDTAYPDVWNYNDHKLQSYQISNPISHSYTAILNLTNNCFIQLENENEWLLQPPSNQISDTISTLRSQENDGKSGEGKWNLSCKVNWSIIFTNNGDRKQLDFIKGNTIVEMSPSGKYIIFFNKEERNYFSYEIISGKVTNITRGVNENWVNDLNGNFFRHRNIGGWKENDTSVIIYGQYDIWQIDPRGLTPPLSITNLYGRKHSIIFSLALDQYNSGYLSEHEVLILTAFNKKTKENGFYQKEVGAMGDPTILTMGSYIYDITDNPSIQSIFSFNVVKAKYVKKYIVKRMSSREAPNYFCTSDFKTFRPISNLHPEKKFNWYSTELHSWLSLNKDSLQGILFKPDDFDSSKKYPVILHYYETKSDAVNAYFIPEALSDACNINIPYYTSNGYLIFCPDIRYSTGDPMKGTYESLISAAEYLSKLPYINKNKMGLQGGSWGAIQTNYLVSQTNLFAAACSASGISNWISGYGSLISYGASLQGMYEIGQFRMGGTLWEKTENYINNSPILFADKITTPILIMHTKDDGICPFSNILEFFIALRRLGKKSWMLVYPGDHGIYGKEAMDFSIRMKQFFDHYLKDKPAPIWMTKGIPANLKGAETGLGLDYTIKTPTSSLISDTTDISVNK
jgi:dipeptidyl aminopeptidase/acylaminoacyl peptidase